jgi:hypothetical protein
LERAADRVRGPRPVQRLCGRHGPLRQVRHRRPGEVELGVQDDRVGDGVAQGVPDVPERARPDLPVVVLLAVQVGRVTEVRVDAPQAGGVVDVYDVESQSATHASSGVGETTSETVTAQ